MPIKSVLIPTTNIWDIGELQEASVNPEKFKELLVRLYQNINNIVLAVNAKENGIYILDEFISGQQFFSNPALDALNPQSQVLRSVYRKVINFGALPDTGTKSVPHGITTTIRTTGTHIYGCATDTAAQSYIPLPFASPILAQNISIDIDSTNVNVTTGSNRSSYTITYIIFEYLQQ